MKTHEYLVNDKEFFDFSLNNFSKLNNNLENMSFFYMSKKELKNFFKSRRNLCYKLIEIADASSKNSRSDMEHIIELFEELEEVSRKSFNDDYLDVFAPFYYQKCLLDVVQKAREKVSIVDETF